MNFSSNFSVTTTLTFEPQQIIRTPEGKELVIKIVEYYESPYTSNYTFDIESSDSCIKIVGILYSKLAGGKKSTLTKNGKQFSYRYNREPHNVGCYSYTGYSYVPENPHPQDFEFEIQYTCDRCFNQISPPSNFVKIPYKIWIHSDRLQQLNRYEFFQDEIILPGFENLELKYIVKKELAGNDVDFIIENKYKMTILKNGEQKNNGHMNSYENKMLAWGSAKKESAENDYKLTIDTLSHLNLDIEFIFDPSTLPTSKTEAAETKSKVSTQDESKFEDQISIKHSDFTAILMDTQFADVILIGFDSKKVPTSRALLAHFSPVFAKIFEERKECPINVEIEGFNESIILASLSFLCGVEKVIGKRNVEKLLEYACKYGIEQLKKACGYFCYGNVNAANVCEFIQIAYSNEFEELKEKCKKILLEEKAQIDKEKVKALPKEIIVDVYF